MCVCVCNFVNIYIIQGVSKRALQQFEFGVQRHLQAKVVRTLDL
jgi:hypothetical protein